MNKAVIIKLLLAMLNSRFLNATPCNYAFVNNLEAFSYENCLYEICANPNITVREMLDSADRFKSCPINKTGLTVI